MYKIINQLIVAIITIGLLASKSHAQNVIDPKLIEIVDTVKLRTENRKPNQSKLRSDFGEESEDDHIVDLVIAIFEATFSGDSNLINSTAINFALQAGETSSLSDDRAAQVYMSYAEAVSKELGNNEIQIQLKQHFTDENWFPRFIAYRLSSYLYAEDSQRQSSLEVAQLALSVIPTEETTLSLYARASILELIAQLHNLQANKDLAISSSKAYLDLTEQDFRSGASLDLLNNLLYSHSVWRDHASQKYLATEILDIEKDSELSVAGLTELRVARSFNDSSDFDQALNFTRIANEKTDHFAVKQQSRQIEAVALAGLGRRSEAIEIAEEINLAYSADELKETTSTDALYLGYLLALNDNDRDLALQLYNRRLDVTSQKLLTTSARDTTSMLASLENSRERQAERAAAAKREAELQEITIQEQRKLNRLLIILVGLLAMASICLLGFLRFRERTMRALAIKTKQAASAEKLKTEFLGLISHELRTPLNGIIGFSDILSRTHSDADVRKKTSVILQSGHELLDIVEAMTDMARIDAGRMDVLPENTQVPVLLAKAAQDFEPKAAKKGIAFTAYIDPALGEHSVDGERLAQCVKTLLSNAISFTNEGRVHLHVTSQKDKDNAVTGLTVNVADTGVGMTDLVLSRLFTPFMQADTSMKRSHMGAGLSLAIARALARLMGGDLTVVSKKGRGSEFTLTVPLAPASVEIKTADTATERKISTRAKTPVAAEKETVLTPPIVDLMQPRAGQKTAPLHAVPTKVQDKDPSTDLEGLRVLIVDDLATNRHVARMMLESSGCICFEVPDGDDALRALHAGPFDVVIMDIHMNRLDGLETTRLIRASRAAFSDIPIIALTADASAETNAACMGAGTDIFLTKPVAAAELYRALQFLQTGQSKRTLRLSDIAETG